MLWVTLVFILRYTTVIVYLLVRQIGFSLNQLINGSFIFKVDYFFNWENKHFYVYFNVNFLFTKIH